MAHVYAEFSQHLQLAQNGELDVLTDDDDNLLARWTNICDHQLESLSSDLDPDAVDAWTLERNTWQLVQALYTERLSESAPPADPSSVGSSKNPYTPPLSVVQRIIEGNKDLIELSAIRDWLHAIPSALSPAEVRRGYLPYTKNKVKQLKRTGAKAPQGLVEDLDPDALLRAGGAQEGARLEPDDAAYERALVRTLYEYVRTGQLDLALDLCRQSDESWRSASLSGGRLWSDAALSPEDDVDAMDEEQEEKRARGNLNRRLWKTMCRKIAASPTLDPYERALYGALSGDVSSVLPVCTSWEDVVWAHLNSLFESHLEASLSLSQSGRYWTRTPPSVAPAPDKLDSEDPLFGSLTQPGTGIRNQLEGVFEKLLKSEKHDLQAAAKNPFHVSQMYLIVDKIGQLLETFVERLELAAGDTEPETLAHLLRFFAHLILVLRLLKQPLPAYAANRILEAYVHVLEANDQEENLIAFYASCLEAESAVESYARFLLTFGPDSDVTSRHVALRKSLDHNLSLPAIARRIVTLVLSSALSAPQPPRTSARAQAVDAYARIDARQSELIRSLEWLTAEKETYVDALSQANALTRYFLASDAPHAALALLRSLPSDLLTTCASSPASSSPSLQLQIREHLDYISFFTCLDHHLLFAEAWARPPFPLEGKGKERGDTAKGKLELSQWKEGVQGLVDELWDKAREVLEGEWLKGEVLEGAAVEDDGTQPRRLAELVAIRRLLIPDLVLRVHHALVSTSAVLPANLSRAFELATIVADERFGLYHEFVPVNDRDAAEGNLLQLYLDEPSLTVTTPTSPPSTSERGEEASTSAARPGPRRLLRNSSSLTQLRRLDPGTPFTRSRSPSPASAHRRLSTSSASSGAAAGASGLSALAQAGLGLLSLPPSPTPSSAGFFPDGSGADDDEQEELASPPRGRPRPEAGDSAPSGTNSRKSSVGFLEPDKESKDKERGRARKMSFGLGGFEGRMRRLSFGTGGGSNAVENPDQHAGSVDPPPPGPPRKSSATKSLIRRAKSFGTSPVIAGSAHESGTFPSPISPAPSPPLPTSALSEPHAPFGASPYPSASPYSTAPSSPDPSQPPPLPRLTTSSLSLGSSQATSASPNGSTPTTPLSAPASSSHVVAPGASYRFRQPSLSRHPEEMALPESVPSQPPWECAAMPVSESPRPESGFGSKGKRQSREPDEKDKGAGTSEIERAGNGKEGTSKKKASAIRRATLSVFGKKDSYSSSQAATTAKAADAPRRNSAEPPHPLVSSELSRSPANSPSQSRKNSANGAGLPSLPSLPSLHLSSNPYRMSWAFGSGSPTTSPAPSPARQNSTSNSPRSGSPIPLAAGTSSRPSLTISPVSSSAPTSTLPSPISARMPPASPTSPVRRHTSGQLPIPPGLAHTDSTDSAQTLRVSLPPRPDFSGAGASPPRMSRSQSTSSPPLLRRTASYATSSPTPSSPLASPPIPLPSPAEATLLDRRKTLTRASRSYSDASDRRSPSVVTPPVPAVSPSGFVYGGGRSSVTGGLGVPPGGGYFASAHYRAGTGSSSRRPGTAESPPTSRSSVFGFGGGWGSLFGGSSSSSGANTLGASTSGSVGMSRSSSAATSTASTPGAGGIETSEFGALFDGGGGGGKSNRPGTGRKRGLSVGAGLFGGGNSTNSASKDREENRPRSGSGSSVASDVPLRPPSVLGRMRASTDPNKRLSLGSAGLTGLGSNDSSGSLAPPSRSTTTSSRPATSEGVASLFGGGSSGGITGRKRGSSLSIVSPSQQNSTTPPFTQDGSPSEDPKREKKYPKPRIEDGETPEQFVRRLVEGEGENGEGKVAKGDVTRVLSASADAFYSSALAAYLRLFPFESLALDIALRLFLCSSSLPSETQQIDRVMEAFARRWCDCNPDVFAADATTTPHDMPSNEQDSAARKKTKSEDSDIPYVLAFSMVMLNTDAFNPNAKSKMTKADYVKNTRIDGVAPEVLEYLYDQITLAPFIFVDDARPDSGHFNPSVSLASSIGRENLPLNGSLGGSTFFNNGNAKGKIDPYYFIASGQTKRFRVDVESLIPFKSPFSYTGTTSFFNATSLHLLFARAPILQITTRPRSSSRSQVTPLAVQNPPPNRPSSASGVAPHPALEGSPLAPTVSSGTFVSNPTKDKGTVSSLKITKAGVLSRKEDLAEGGRKAASRKWKAWSVVLTGSQLLFFKDSHFAQSLQQALENAAASAQPRPDDHHVLSFTLQTPFKPDAVLSLANTAALFDSTYKRHPNVFRLVAPAGRQYLFQAQSADDLNAWLHAINYAASFKSANVRIRPLQPPPLRASNGTPVPGSPATSSASSNAVGSPQMAWTNTTGSLASDSTSTESQTRKNSVVADHASELEPVVPDSEEATETLAAVGATQQQHAAADNETRTLRRPSSQASLQSHLTKVLPNRPLPDPPGPAFAPPLVPIVNTRSDILRSRISDLDAQIRQARDVVQRDLRLAKHLAILTPFRSSTREKVLTAIPPIEKRIRQARMHLVKLICYREVLSRDLLVEDRETERLIRKHSLQRSHSRRVSSSPRPSSPASHHVHGFSTPRDQGSTVGKWSSPLSYSQSSLVVPSFSGDGIQSEGGRHSFDSASESFSNFDTAHSLTDDELDRLQVRSPPAMQRSRTEQDWTAAMEHLSTYPNRNLVPTDDELELPPPVGAGSSAGTPTKARRSPHLPATRFSPPLPTASLEPSHPPSA
ncbi:hypothetical protein JCM10212_001681 [Sporobolomyces blumeae]